MWFSPGLDFAAQGGGVWATSSEPAPITPGGPLRLMLELPGRVAEMVIYSWDWEDVKKSPDFPVIDQLGQEIAALIPKEVEEGYYFKYGYGNI